MNMKERFSKKKNAQGRLGLLPILLAGLLLCFCLCACGPGAENIPYEPDTPAPAAHDGEFVSEHGSMRFNGDGKTVVIDFDSFLAGLTGLPEGEQNAEYVFLSGDLPPHGSMPVRYDTAHELQLSVGDRTVVIDLAIASADGKTATGGTNTVTPELIPMLFSDDGGKFTVRFEKSR